MKFQKPLWVESVDPRSMRLWRIIYVIFIATNVALFYLFSLLLEKTRAQISAISTGATEISSLAERLTGLSVGATEIIPIADRAGRFLGASYDYRELDGWLSVGDPAYIFIARKKIIHIAAHGIARDPTAIYVSGLTTECQPTEGGFLAPLSGLANQGPPMDFASPMSRLPPLPGELILGEALAIGGSAGAKIYSWDREGKLTDALSRITGISSRMEALESALTSDPAKSLNVELLRKDIDSMSKSLEQRFASAKADVDRVYDLAKWVIAFLSAITFGLLIPLIGGYLKKEPPLPVAAVEKGKRPSRATKS